MNILLIHPYYLPAGVAGSVRWNETVGHWILAGHRVTVLAGTIDYLTGKPYGQLTHETAEPAVRVVRVRMSGLYNRGRLGRMWAYGTFFWMSLWVGFFRLSNDYDLVLATSPPLTTGLTGWLLATWHQKPFVLELRDLWPDAPVQMGYLRNPLAIRLSYWLERFLYRRSAHLIPLTSAFEQVLVRNKGVVGNRGTTLANGSDLVMTHSALADFDRQVFRVKNGLEGRFWVIYAGAHGPANGLMAVLDAADTLRGEAVGFLLLGDGPQKVRLQAEVTRRKLPNVRFMPALPKSHALRWIAAADAGLVCMLPLPVFRTMLSAKLFDYLACGKPVITAIDGLTRQLVEEHQFGLFVDPTQPGSWRSQICSYLGKPALVAAHGQNARNYACNVANRALLAHEYITVLNRVHRHYQAES